MPEHDPAPRREPEIDWSVSDEIPVLTEIVDADDIAAQSVEIPAEGDGPGALPAIHAEQRFDAGDGMEAAAMEEPFDLTPLWNSRSSSRPPESRLDTMRTALTAELEVAATRIVAESVKEVETLLVERVSQRLKDELAGIVGATLHEFERRGKRST